MGNGKLTVILAAAWGFYQVPTYILGSMLCKNWETEVEWNKCYDNSGYNPILTILINLPGAFTAISWLAYWGIITPTNS
jgi:hypothetical protein